MRRPRLPRQPRKPRRLRHELDSLIWVLDGHGRLIETVNPVTLVRTQVSAREVWSNAMESCSALLDADDTWQMMIAETHDAADSKLEVMPTA